MTSTSHDETLSTEVPEGQRLGHRLREARLKAKHTQQSAGSGIGRSISTVQRAEATGLTSLPTLRALCALYRVPLASLFQRESP